MKMKRILLIALVLLLVMTGIVTAATIELPATGQDTCYDSSGAQISCSVTGQDGDTQAGAALPIPRFTPDYYGLTAVDNLTGLMWTLDSRTPDEFPLLCAPPERLRSFRDALNYVACLNTNNFLNHSDWRLPNRNELRSLIVDNSTSAPALPEGHPFINVEQAYTYWSSTTCYTILEGTKPKKPDEGAWMVGMWDGSETCGDKASEGLFVWPVRAGQTDGNPDPTYPANLPATGQTISYAAGDDGDLQTGVAWPSPRFTVTYCDTTGPCPNPSVDCDGDPLNDVLTDNLTSLIWVRVPDNIHRTWVEALTYSNGLNTCGYTNWRLPNINELESMINNGQPDTAAWLDAVPPLPPEYFIGVESFLNWTSTTHRTERDQAMVVDLWDGNVESHPKSESYYAWPVRFPGYQLSVTKAGAGTGTVTSSPSGIDCGSDCKEILPEGTQVTLTAHADPGFIFKGWNICDGTGSCTVTMNADTIVRAVFGTCNYTISPVNALFTTAGGTINVSVVASGLPSCPAPSVSSDATWITAQLIKFQNNAGTVRVTAAPNYSSYTRTDSVSIGNATFVARQAKRICPLPTLTPSSMQFPQVGGDGSFTVSFPPKAPADCGWVAKPKTSWIFICVEGAEICSTQGTYGIGNGTVSYIVSPNAKLERDGDIRVILTQNPTLWSTFRIHQLY